MREKPKIEDLIGLGHSKLGFYKEVQEKIVELRKFNRALELQRQHVQAILDGITDIVAVISPDYRIASVNHSFFEIYAQGSPEGEHCYDIFRGRSEPCDSCVLRDALEQNCVCHQDAMIAVGDHYRHFSITATPLRDSDGQPTDILVVKRDVTLEKEFQAKYYYAEKMATIGLLAAGVAHEINNPLTSIRGFAEGLQRRMATLADAVSDDTLKSDFAEYLEIILKECRRCSGIVRSLLTFSPRRSPEFSRIGLNELVRNVLRILHHKLKQYPDRLIQQHLDEALPTIQANAAELEQVILNLVLNAIDAVEAEHGAIVIRTRVTDERRVILEIEDNGCGIPPEDQQKLFEPFFTTKPVGKGIGIGLSTCYHIIKSHGGEIQVASTPGQGACFSVVLPVTFRSGES